MEQGVSRVSGEILANVSVRIRGSLLRRSIVNIWRYWSTADVKMLGWREERDVGSFVSGDVGVDCRDSALW